MAEVKVELTGGVERKGARIDDDQLTFDDAGKASADVAPGLHFLYYWPEILAGDEAMAAALLDRLLHRCHVLNIRGRSYRLHDLERMKK